MGNSASKSVPPKAVPNIPKKITPLDESFGRQIMKNIKLKETPFSSNNHQAALNPSGLKKRIELNKRTEGSISWNELPLIFSDDYIKLSNIDKNKMDEIRKYFSFTRHTDKPIKK